MRWQTVIGLEVHVQLATDSKIFSGASSHYGQAPNSQACPIDLGMPGMLPVLNRRAVDMAVLFGLSIQADIGRESVFARKHYFYPDLPKGYQTSQHTQPIVESGVLEITLPDGSNKLIGIERAHLEEDAGKSMHQFFKGYTGIDLNRAGTPLLEIVSRPDMRSAEEAVAYLKTLHALVRCLGISDGNMQEGSFRCDCNVSVMPEGSDTLGTRTESKNINSFRFVEKAIHHEAARQIELLESGQTVRQETRLFDPSTGTTRSMRSKEDATDYRYFPDPDLLPVHISNDQIKSIAASMPELPWEKKARFQKEHQLNAYDAHVLTSQPTLSTFFEEVIAHGITPKLTANWISSELLGHLNKHHCDITDCPITAVRFAGLLARIEDNTISGKIAKTVFEAMWTSDHSADDIIEQQGLKQISDTGELEAIIQQVLTDNPTQCEQYRSGKDKLFGFFVGQVMKVTQGKANPEQVNALLKKALQ